MYRLPDSRDLRTWFDTVFRPRRLLNRSANTTRLYLQLIDRLDEHLGRCSTLDDLNDGTLCGFLQWRLNSGRSTHTVARERAEIVALANYAAKKRAIDEFPDVPSIVLAEIRPEAYGPEQLNVLLAACETSIGPVGKCPGSTWWLALHYVFLFTGERTTAVLSLRWEWLDWNTGWLAVPAHVRKGKRKPMAYKLPETVLERLRPLYGFTGASGLVFDPPWRPAKYGAATGFYKRYEGLLRRAGLPTGRRWKPQRLRRTFASYLEKQGGDATAALGHSSRKITVTNYLDPTILGKLPPASLVAEAYKLG